jgi:hypothetical protein
MNERLEELQERIIENIKENEGCIAEDDLSPTEIAELYWISRMLGVVKNEND